MGENGNHESSREGSCGLGRRVLFPITIVPFTDVHAWTHFDADLGQDLAKEVRSYFIPDFGEWKINHDLYSREFERLINALKAEK